MSNFIVEFPLITEPYQEHILNKRFEIGRIIYNTLVNKTKKIYKEMIKTKKYRELQNKLSDDEKSNKLVWKEINNIHKENGFSEYSFHKLVSKPQKYFKKNIDSFTAQKIATRLWLAYDKFFYGNGEKIYFKKFGTLNSLEGKSNSSGIRFRNNKIYWNKLIIPVKINYSNSYEYKALQHKICYNRIIRRYVKNKYKYYVQIVFEGIPPTKINQNTGEVKHHIGNGDVGLDIGTSTIAISSMTDVKIFELADKVKNIEREKLLLQRKMSRSRFSTNPNNYNSDGTIKSQGNRKGKWIKSNHYIKYQKQLRELYRKQTAVRKYQHECLANYIISLGDKFFVEKINFKALQKCATKTEKNEKGKFKRKKRFGKSLGNRAPSMLLTIINRKLSYYGTELIEINTYKAKASQFNHMDNTFKKKKLSQRWNNLNGIKVQRDMYSAYLIMNINKDLETFNMKKCNDRFDNFLKLHNKEVNRLKNHKNLSCIAI